MIEEHGVSSRQACKALNLARSTYSYQPVKKNDEYLIEQLNALVEKHPAIGFWQSFHRLRRQGIKDNHKRVYRIYTMLKLNIRRRYRKRLPARIKQALFKPAWKKSSSSSTSKSKILVTKRNSSVVSWLLVVVRNSSTSHSSSNI